MLGSIEIIFLPSLNSILFSILIIFIGASLFFIPALDISSIKSAELGSYNKENPNGFDGREICAISRYAGISNKVSSFSLFEIDTPNSFYSSSLIPT